MASCWKKSFVFVFLQYEAIHRLETNKLRNVAKMFAHMLYTDGIPWTVSFCWLTPLPPPLPPSSHLTTHMHIVI